MRRVRRNLTLLACGLLLLLAAGRRLEAGDRAPGFTLESLSGESVAFEPPARHGQLPFPAPTPPARGDSRLAL